ncbi:RNA polymerase sigma factor [Virgibacillus necropolis]|uniref:RNA polymerase n=1 Tax=Virgibacillus necropolis TaxID=163877 RepID=A0A221MH34_9BACI|nr:sigma-70 family RNA polymerase sigma factor [Virgibacillus necropolis]ASN06940.1 RNA polymerase [Virgibacillus necropolis]
MEEKTDAALIKLINKKHRPALEELYERYIKLIYSVVFKFCNGNEEVAKEMVQLVFLKLWTTKSSYDPSKGKFVNWLLTIVRNVCIDYIRKEKKHPHDNSQYETDRTSNLADPIDPIDENIKGIEIAKAKNKLSASQRRVIDLLYWEGYSLTEIAEIENAPVGTIKSRLYQSLKQLKKYLELEGS